MGKDLKDSEEEPQNAMVVELKATSDVLRESERSTAKVRLFRFVLTYLPRPSF